MSPLLWECTNYTAVGDLSCEDCLKMNQSFQINIELGDFEANKFIILVLWWSCKQGPGLER